MRAVVVSWVVVVLLSCCCADAERRTCVCVYFFDQPLLFWSHVCTMSTYTFFIVHPFLAPVPFFFFVSGGVIKLYANMSHLW